MLAFVTSRQPDEPLDTDIVLDPQDPDFAQTGLQVRSTIRIHRLLTVASSIIKRELGSLSPSRQARVADAVLRLFAVGPEDSLTTPLRTRLWLRTALRGTRPRLVLEVIGPDSTTALVFDNGSTAPGPPLTK